MTDDQYYSKKTKVHWTCKALLDNHEISYVTKIQEVSIWRLGANIHRLKSDLAWPIQTRYRALDNVAFYSLKPDADRATMRFPPFARAPGIVEGVQ